MKASTDSPVAQALAVSATLLERQHEAAVHGDAAGLNRQLESLAQLMVELEMLAEEAPSGPDPRVAELVARLRNQIRTNLILAMNGSAISDHYVSLVGATSGLFNGVA
jgi:hypothetical protein